MRKLMMVVAVVAALWAVPADAHHGDDDAMSRRQWVNAVLRHTNGVTRVEARRIWRTPALRRQMPVTSHTTSRGSVWVNPAAVDGAVGGCQVSTSRTEYGYGVKAVGTFLIPTRDPLFKYTLHRTWTHDGWQVFPEQAWDDDWIEPFADLRWNFDGAHDIEDVWFQVGQSAHATQRHSRKGRFTSLGRLGGAVTDVERHVLAKWHGGWETAGRNARFCTDN